MMSWTPGQDHVNALLYATSAPSLWSLLTSSQGTLATSSCSPPRIPTNPCHAGFRLVGTTEDSCSVATEKSRALAVTDLGCYCLSGAHATWVRSRDKCRLQGLRIASAIGAAAWLLHPMREDLHSSPATDDHSGTHAGWRPAPPPFHVRSCSGFHAARTESREACDHPHASS